MKGRDLWVLLNPNIGPDPEFWQERDVWVSLNGGIDPERWQEKLQACRCGITYRVTWNKARGFREREEYYCPSCRCEGGTVLASDCPHTEEVRHGR